MDEIVNNSEISFSVDAGLIDRLGRELVGRAETAVSELIKNSYDADATVVDVNFINSYWRGGTLLISDNGVGMTFDQLKLGFMTISSTDKVHNPTSLKYYRSKAGKKGIGRFATQRLGRRLIITTQTLQSSNALRLTIDWDKYGVDQDITKITNPIEYVEKIKPEGTTLAIENLREGWTEAEIKRIYRYVSDLFQPDYLSQNSQIENIAKQNDSTFNVIFRRTENSNTVEIASPQKMIFDKSLAIIEGNVDSSGRGFFGVNSSKLDLNDKSVAIHKSESEHAYSKLKNVYFKAYYFIYNRVEYYSNITSLELTNIRKLAGESSGIRLYRNGFRVLPYGELQDDWLGLDIRYSGESGQTNIPFSNNNLFGFVEILDKEGVLFQETASREGLIENAAFKELISFLDKAFEAARRRISEKITLIRKQKPSATNDEDGENLGENDKKTIEDEFNQIDEELNKSSGNVNAKDAIKSIKEKYYEVIEELSMLRILASLGLTIGEYTHEIIQYTPSINGFISKLYEVNQGNNEALSIIGSLDRAIANFTSYSAYFNSTVSENTSREVKPILITDVVTYFVKNIKDDLLRQNTEINNETYGHDLFTLPMHISEWSSILYNLYTNSKKAIKRANVIGKIKIVTGSESNIIYLEFSDNGDGIPEKNKERVFNAFFTTSTPAGFDAPMNDKLTGTGLGLKIVKDIVETYDGNISIISPEEDFKTCFRIELPKATKEQIKEYGV